jgi:hypothetical protein
VVSKPGKVIVVRQRRFFGAMLVDLRIHIGSAAGRPTKKGISLPINFVREIGRVLADFEPQPEPPND